MDADSENRLCDLRFDLAEICLEGRTERIATLCRSTSGDALMTTVHSGVRHLAMSKADQADNANTFTFSVDVTDANSKQLAAQSAAAGYTISALNATFGGIDLTANVATINTEAIAFNGDGTPATIMGRDGAQAPTRRPVSRLSGPMVPKTWFPAIPQAPPSRCSKATTIRPTASPS